LSSSDEVLAKVAPEWKLWLEYDGEYVFGPGAYAILKSIDEEGTITAGAAALDMSYRYAWGIVKDIEKKLGVRILETYRGGNVGGGGAKITPEGRKLMNLFAAAKNKLESATADFRNES
jgi:molybdate transport repressor ModE-like protein